MQGPCSGAYLCPESLGSREQAGAGARRTQSSGAMEALDQERGPLPIVGLDGGLQGVWYAAIQHPPLGFQAMRVSVAGGQKGPPRWWRCDFQASDPEPAAYPSTVRMVCGGQGCWHRAEPMLGWRCVSLPDWWPDAWDLDSAVGSERGSSKFPMSLLLEPASRAPCSALEPRFSLWR